jgi:hypothetical protein
MQKIILGVVIIVIGFSVLYYSFVSTEQKDTNPEITQYFQEEMFKASTSGGLIPIEGFDAGLLLGAFPDLVAADFDGVQAFEGVYTIEDNQAVFKRTQSQPISSAESTVSTEGYVTLLENVSTRLNLPVQTEADIDALIIEISSSDSLKKYEDGANGISFSYRTGENGYVLQEHVKDAYADPLFIKVYTLMLKSDYEFMQTMTDASEGPPTINIAIFKNAKKQSASVWIDENPSLSNINLLTGVIDRDAVVGGANAVRYMIDGLYKTDTVVVAHGGLMYVISGAFLDENSGIHQDFETFLDSIIFTEIK